jgi:hypothetical protein
VTTQSQAAKKPGTRVLARRCSHTTDGFPARTTVVALLRTIS